MKESVPFSETFSNDKPIYYPWTWEEGRTALQLHEEWQTTWSYWVLTNAVECALGAIWVFVIWLLLLSIAQLYNIWKLKPHQRRKYRREMEGNFLMGVGFVAFVVSLATVILLWASPIARYALAKGFLTFTLAYVLYSVYRQSFPHRKHR